MAKRKALGGGSDSAKMRKKSDHSKSKFKPSSSKGRGGGSGRDRKGTGPRLPIALRKQIDMISSSSENKHSKEIEEEDRGEVDEEDTVNDVYEYVPQKPQEALRKNRRFDVIEKVKLDLPEDFEDEDVPSDDEIVYGFNSDIKDSDDEDDEERHARMLNRVTDMPATVFKGKKRKHDVIIPEVHPESEYNPTRDILEGNDTVTLEDLISGFGKKSKYSKVRKRIKQMERKSEPVHAPLPKPDKDRLERRVAYDKLKKDMTKMEPVVKRNREAATVYFDVDTNVGFPTIGAFAAEFKPQNDFEKKMESVLDDKMIQEAHTKDGSRLLEMNKDSISIQDVRERQNHLAKMRSLLFKHDLKAKHIKKIKSKTYHRLNKKGKLKTVSDLHMDPESAKEQAMKQEFKRAEERMTLKHKNSSKWAKRNLKRGLAIQDEGTRAAIAEQLHTHEILTRKMKSMNSDSSSDDEDDDSEFSDGSNEEGASEVKLVEKAKHKTQKLIEEDEELPNSGVLSLPFMVRGLKKKQEAANEEARQAFQEYEMSLNPELTESTHSLATNGRRIFGNVKKEIQESKRRAKPEVEYNSSDSEYEVETKDNVDLERCDNFKDVNIDAALFQEETDNTATSVFKNFKDIVKDPGPKTTFEVSILAPKPVKKTFLLKQVKHKEDGVGLHSEQRTKDVKMPLESGSNLEGRKSSKTVTFDLPENKDEEIDEDSDTDSEVQMIDGMLSSGTRSTHEPLSQAELIRLAFAGDDVEDEFRKEKEAVINEENPQPEEPKLVPGWGDWTHTQKKRGLPPWMVKEYEDAKRKTEEELKKRKDKNLSNAIIYEKTDKKAEKLFAKTLPFPFTSADVYHQSIRMPTGPDFIPTSTVGEANRPSLVKRPGVIIQPIHSDDAIPYENAEDTSSKTRGKNKRGKTFSVKPKPNRS